jgi:iron-sulfur cluster repair protein YtfE (RIC family)
MSLVPTLTDPGNFSRVPAGSSQYLPGEQSSGQNIRNPAHHADKCFLQHPNREWPPNEVVHHIVEVHHDYFRQSLMHLTSLLQASDSLGTVFNRRWNIILQRMIKLEEAFLSGMQYEESVVFPQLLHWQAKSKQHSPPSELLAAANAVERSHAICLQMLWWLLRRTRDEMQIPPVAGHHRQFFDQLAALCDDYEQHLFEEECLLLPTITSFGTISIECRSENAEFAQVGVSDVNRNPTGPTRKPR